ncbi:hypothetical protein OG874_16355 [Nocardia sp. NBC_00565]|uniref:hypothetical protein n=1 Tax=Nocardia sp. NBC_00565 TaxID=2975993 RepID=UPI002E822599|nr:hypothetical protein [Nocardia sp. NBC_00565]WUC06591.1 hypothetical protein OG874_16355 [Nocardia sp. NBC_00565]
MNTLTDDELDEQPSRAHNDKVKTTPQKVPRRFTIRLSTAITVMLSVLAVASITVLTVLLVSARGELADHDAHAADEDRSKQVAMDYAVGASTIDYRDTKAWYTKLKANTTPQLAGRFDATAPQLDQILLPLQWTSTAHPITAVVTSSSSGIYKVNAFLNVTSTSVQTPQGGQTTVTYSLTIDKNSGWKITEVGGLDGALPIK